MALLAVASPGVAQDSESSWRHTIVVYFMGAGLDGESQVGPVTADIDASFSDILENLEFGAMGAYSARKGPWGFNLDAIFMGLGGDATGPVGTRFDVDVDELVVSADVSFRFNDRFETLAGLRYNSLDMTVAVQTPGGATAEASQKEEWVDPYVGARLTAPFAGQWAFVLRGDVGGFGVGSDLAWQAVARFEWRVSDSASISIGYRIYDVDYADGAGSDLFRYDVATSGPLAGMSWSF